jgi:hypothetical protein
VNAAQNALKRGYGPTGPTYQDVVHGLVDFMPVPDDKLYVAVVHVACFHGQIGNDLKRGGRLGQGTRQSVVASEPDIGTGEPEGEGWTFKRDTRWSSRQRAFPGMAAHVRTPRQLACSTEGSVRSSFSPERLDWWARCQCRSPVGT